jgi:hypothetical protein
MSGIKQNVKNFFRGEPQPGLAMVRDEGSPSQMEQGLSRIPDEPEVYQASPDGDVVLMIFIDGLSYKLQHPGVETFLRWRDDSMDLREGKLNTRNVLKNAFEHCVFPEGHNYKPSLANLRPKYLEAWDTVLTRFLKGTLV